MRALPLAALGLLATAMLAVANAAPIKLPRYVASGDRNLPKVQYADTLVSINKRCTVRKLLMTPTTRPVYVNSKPLGFCCRMCTWTFVLDPAKYIKEEGLSVNCPVSNPTRPAVLDPTLMVAINWEYYFFSDREAMAKFQQNPLKYTGKLTDPVLGKRFTPRAKSPKLVHQGRTYYFASGANRNKYKKDPNAFSYRAID